VIHRCIMHPSISCPVQPRHLVSVAAHLLHRCIMTLSAFHISRRCRTATIAFLLTTSARHSDYRGSSDSGTRRRKTKLPSRRAYLSSRRVLTSPLFSRPYLSIQTHHQRVLSCYTPPRDQHRWTSGFKVASSATHVICPASRALAHV